MIVPRFRALSMVCLTCIVGLAGQIRLQLWRGRKQRADVEVQTWL